MRILIAPQAFKGTLSARRAAGAIARGACAASRCDPGPTELDVAWLADGGDGSVDALVAAGWTRVPVSTRGAMGDYGPASIAVQGTKAAVEIANACGLARHGSRPLDPLTASSTGLGDALRAALDHAPAEVTVFLGGSASTDGGAGMLEALGARVNRWGSADMQGLDPRLAGVTFTVATDVDSPLHGPDGAARVFAPQKGADSGQVEALDARLAEWSRALAAATGVDPDGLPGAGAAGGAGAALMCALGAERVSGADVIARALRLDERIAAADLVVTAEGRFDEQSLRGKGAFDVVRRAREHGTPVVLLCGSAGLRASELAALGITASRTLVDGMTDPWLHPAQALESAAREAIAQARAQVATPSP